ncbi:hypothetical protein [Williamsia sp.]|uniref:hypothetical protein n=1 Tax=Williamsia sp. TaxID=1872085 RepID=UPI001A24A6FB|nr:hypothetical protein [Williamsia sp.]MBJ7291606.1 hypothetical protein [Williamsia sp.]
MGIVTSTDTDDNRKVAAAKTAGSAALGYLVPWTRPARVVATRVGRRRHAKKARALTPSAVTPLLSARRTSRVSGRNGLVILGIAGVIGGGVVFSALRARRNTPAPVAAQPPRVEDVPTR